jgi:hypothetical protein
MTIPRPDLARLTDAALFDRYGRTVAMLELSSDRDERRLIWNRDVLPLHAELSRRYPPFTEP